MKNVHDFKIRDIDFSGYLLNFRRSLNVPCTRNVNVGEFVRLFEFDVDSNVLTGRHLLYRITFIDKTPGLIGIGNVWLLDLIKIEPKDS